MALYHGSASPQGTGGGAGVNYGNSSSFIGAGGGGGGETPGGNAPCCVVQSVLEEMVVKVNNQISVEH